MITVSTFAIGEKYEIELKHMMDSVSEESPWVNLVVGVGKPLKNEMDVLIFKKPLGVVPPQKSSVTIPVSSELINNWNNIGFIKSFWMLHVLQLMRSEQLGDIQLWIDADARVRGDLRDLDGDLRDAAVGMVKFLGEHWLAGTIAVRDTRDNEEWIARWWHKCRQLFREEHTDWRLNDQTVLRNMMLDGDCPLIIDLGEKWASIPPELVGDKNDPIPVYPSAEDALIWHWQASRSTVKGWNWPPDEDKRRK